MPTKGPVQKLPPGFTRYEITYRASNDEGGFDPYRMWKTAPHGDEEFIEKVARELYQRVVSKGKTVDILSIKDVGNEIAIDGTGKPTQVVSPEEYRRMKNNEIASLSPKDLQDRAREWGWPRLAKTLTEKKIDKILKGEA